MTSVQTTVILVHFSNFVSFERIRSNQTESNQTEICHNIMAMPGGITREKSYYEERLVLNGELAIDIDAKTYKPDHL